MLRESDGKKGEIYSWGERDREKRKKGEKGRRKDKERKGDR